MPPKTYHKPTTIRQAFNNPYYQGKIVIESPEGLYSTTKEENAIKTYRSLTKKYSAREVTSTVIPKGMLMPLPQTAK